VNEAELVILKGR